MAEGLAFDWDDDNVGHIARHRVTPEEAEQVLRNDPFDLNYETLDGEERWTAVGHTDSLRVVLVVWTLRADDRVRVATARQASKTASLMYLREKGFGS